MKKAIGILIAALIIIGLGVLVYRLANREEKITIDAPTAKADLANATFTFFDDNGSTDITLEDGKHTSEEIDGISIETSLSKDVTATGDLNNDGKEDAVGILTQYGGGTGVFVYAVAEVSGPVRYNGSNAVFIGDRIGVESIKISNGKVRITYLDRGADEPFAAEPTVETTKVLAFRNGELVEE